MSFDLHFNQNIMNLSPNEDNITNNTFNDRNELFVEFVANDADVYESFESHDQDMDDRQRDPHLMDTSNDSQNQSQYCVNNCEKMINRLIADNEELKKMKDQLIAIEEQNVELIKDKQRSDSAMNHLRESFERKILLKNEAIDDLKKSLYIFESLNTSLHKELEEKRLQKQRLEAYIKEIEDKLYFSEIQLIECQKSEECLLTSYNNARQAFTEEEDNKYKTLEQLQTAYVECAQQHNEIQELKQQISDLDREIADRDTELWFYKTKFDESLNNCVNCVHKCDQNPMQSPRESILINKTNTEIPDYSFSVNDDDMDHIFDDFNDNIPPKLSPITDESNEFQSLLESENIEQNNSVVNEENDKRVSLNLFQRILRILTFVFFKIPFKIIFVIIFIAYIVITLTLSTRLPAYTSWEEIIYRLFLPYLTKVKTSKTQ